MINFKRYFFIILIIAISFVSCHKKSIITDLKRKDTFVIAIGGDVLLGRGVAKRAENRGWSAITKKLSPYFADVDYAIVNLESPIGKCLPGGSLNFPRLCGKEEGVRALAQAGITAVTLSNNHFLDAGKDGLKNTVKILKKYKIKVLGADVHGVIKPDIFDGFIIISANITKAAHKPGSTIPIPSPETLTTAVINAKKRFPSKPVIVILHIGREYDLHLSNRDFAYANAIKEAGADAIAMHGAHVVKKFINDPQTPAHFGLGNLLFDQKRKSTQKGEILKLHFKKIHNKYHLIKANIIKTSTQ